MTGHQSHSEDSGGDYEDEAAIPDVQWQSQHQDSVPSAASRGNHPSSPSQAPRVSAPTQKRRRVTRACDECRRKKIKCDGRQPCNHCTVYTYDCTFDQPSNRRRNPAPQYVEALEHRLQRAEVLLKTVLPNANLDDPNFDLRAAQRPNSSLQTEVETPQPGQLRPWIPLEKAEQAPIAEKDPLLESMVENTGLMDLDDEGNWDFHGHSSGRVFLRRMRTQFGDLMGKSVSLPFMKYKQIGQTIESPKPLADVSLDPRLPKTHDLPRKECALLLSGNALDDAGAILRLVHQPTYYAMLHRVYDIPYEEFSDDEFKFLPLVYGVIALGALFGRAEQSELQTNGYSNAIEQG